MTEHNHVLNKTLAYLLKGSTLPVSDALELVHQVREEGRAMAWDSAEARTVAADAQAYQVLRAAVLATVDDPFVWDDGMPEAEVLAAWVRRLAEARSVVLSPAVLLEMVEPAGPDGADTQPMVTLTGLHKRPCGGAAGRHHEPHTYALAGTDWYCDGVPGRGGIPHQHGADPSETGDPAA